jgi:hypothetical protein
MTFRRNPLAVALAGLVLAAPAAQGHPVTKASWTTDATTADARVDWEAVAMGAGGGVALATLAALGLGAGGVRPAG